MLMLHYGTPRDQEARAQLGAVLPGAQISEPDEIGVFLEHPELPEHWRPRSGRPAA
jgi:hypothetical protein